MKTVAPRDLIWEVIFTDFLDCDLTSETDKKTMGGWTGSLKAILIDCLPDITVEDTRKFIKHWRETNTYATKTRDEEKIRSAIGEWHKTVETTKPKAARAKCTVCKGEPPKIAYDAKGRSFVALCEHCGGSGYEAA